MVFLLELTSVAKSKLTIWARAIEMLMFSAGTVQLGFSNIFFLDLDFQERSQQEPRWWFQRFFIFIPNPREMV